MKPSKPFLFLLALVAVVAVGVIETPRAIPVAAQDAMPLSTRLTPAMIDYFGLDVAFERPSIAALVACEAAPACGTSDSLQVRFLDGTGRTVADYDATPATTIEQVRRLTSTPADGVTEHRTSLRRFITDEQGRIVMQGRDSIVRVTRAMADSAVTTLTRVHRYSDVRYLVSDPTFVWPLTGLVMLELSNVVGSTPRTSTPLVGHAAVSFDGTSYAHVLTNGALTHRVNLRAKLLETTMPDR